MRKVLTPAAAVLVAAGLAGCGGDVPRSTVRGTVTFQGRPLARAAVVFLASDNATHLLDLKPDGTYVVTGVARGPVKVVVQPEPEQAAASRPVTARPNPESAKDAARLAADPPLRRGPPVDPKYASPDTSGLAFELTEPEQEWSVDLK